MFLQGPMLEEGGSGKSSQSVFLPQGRLFFFIVIVQLLLQSCHGMHPVNTCIFNV